MKKIIIPFLIGAVIVVGVVVILKSKKPISPKPSLEQPSTQINKLQGAVNVCDAFPKEKIGEFLGKEITKSEVATNEINPEPSCYYYLGTKTVYLELNQKGNINEQINGWKALNSTIKEETKIPLKNFVVYTQEGKVRRIYLIIDEKTFLTIDTWGLGLSEDEEISFASKLANYLKSEFGVK